MIVSRCSAWNWALTTAGVGGDAATACPANHECSGVSDDRAQALCVVQSQPVAVQWRVLRNSTRHQWQNYVRSYTTSNLGVAVVCKAYRSTAASK